MDAVGRSPPIFVALPLGYTEEQGNSYLAPNPVVLCHPTTLSPQLKKGHCAFLKAAQLWPMAIRALITLKQKIAWRCGHFLTCSML
jgi:hypothetical protein